MAQARFAAEAGVDIVQVRERDLEAAELVSVVAAILKAVRGTGTRVLVNDRIDVALATGADGVHLRGTSVTATDARKLAPPRFVIGRSVHGAEEARIASIDADYVIAGAVWSTASKPSSATVLGTEGLMAIVRAAGVPVLAIGGVTAANATGVAAAGAAGVAGIGLFMDAPGTPCRAMPLMATTAAIRSVFDMPRTAS